MEGSGISRTSMDPGPAAYLSSAFMSSSPLQGLLEWSQAAVCLEGQGKWIADGLQVILPCNFRHQAVGDVDLGQLQRVLDPNDPRVLGIVAAAGPYRRQSGGSVVRGH